MHETVIHVRWGELDPYGHVNHAAYLSYLEHARIAALEHIGWGMGSLRDRGYQVVVTRADVRFRRPAAAAEQLVIDSWIEELRPASSRWRQTIRRGDKVILEAEITAACTTADGRPTRTPQDFQQALKKLERIVVQDSGLRDQHDDRAGTRPGSEGPLPDL